jgi:uncharacterized membrane protein YeaQ/YmgE (transglycosylase-associated protein family)
MFSGHLPEGVHGHRRNDHRRADCWTAGAGNHAWQGSDGWVATILLGIVGSFVGGLLGSLVFHDSSPGTSDIHPTGILGSIIGALIVLGIYRLASRRRAVP